jgi:hypothetical protein
LGGFNSGVEIGQLTLVAGVLAIIWVLSRLRIELSRRMAIDVASSFLFGLGLFWFVNAAIPNGV